MYRLYEMKPKKKSVGLFESVSGVMDHLEKDNSFNRGSLRKSINKVINPSTGNNTILNKAYTVEVVEGINRKETDDTVILSIVKELFDIESSAHEESGMLSKEDVVVYCKVKGMTQVWAELVAEKWENYNNDISGYLDGDEITFRDLNSITGRRYLIGDRKLYKKKKMGAKTVYTLSSVFKDGVSIVFSINTADIPNGANTFELIFFPDDNTLLYSPRRRMNGKELEVFSDSDTAIIQDPKGKSNAELTGDVKRLRGVVMDHEKKLEKLEEVKEFMTYLKLKDPQVIKKEWEQFQTIKKEMF